MGAGSDIHSRAEVIENSYLQDSYGIERLLKEYLVMVEKSLYQYDPSAQVLAIDLCDALDREIFTPVERQVLNLMYFAQLSINQTAKLLNIKAYDVMDTIAESFEKVAAVLMGYVSKKLPDYVYVKHTLPEWLQAVGEGKAPIYTWPSEVNTELLHWLADNRDHLAEETLKQRVEGPPERFVEPYSVSVYPYYDEKELELLDQRLNVTYLPKKETDGLARGRTVVGGRKVAFYDDNEDVEDGEKGNHVMVVVNAKIYK